MQKLERLLNLTAVLLHTGRPLTVNELRERVPGYPDGDVAFRRSFERDKDDLREMGLPIDLVPIPGTDPPAEGYRIPRNQYYLPDPGLEPDELAALQLAAAAVRVDDTAGTEALWKLGGASRGAEVVPMSASIPTDANLPALFNAVSSRSVVTFEYRGEVREVQPYRLGFQSGFGHWYLRGFDLARDGIRAFRLDRIDGPIAAGRPGAFDIPDDERNATEILPDRWQLGNDPPVVARVHIDQSHAPVALAQFHAQHIAERHDDGSIDIEMVVTNRAAFRSMVLSYMQHAEILEPQELRDELMEWLGGIAAPVSGGSR